MHFLQGPFDSALGKIVQHLVPTHRFISAHDLFNPQLFHACLITTINDIPELASHLETITLSCVLKEVEGQNASGYVQLRLRNFITIWEAMRSALDYLNLTIVGELGKQTLFRMVKECDMDYLQVLLQHLFELVIRNHKIVEFITGLPQQDQSRIKDFVQKVKEKTELHIEERHKSEDGEEDERRQLEEENNELRGLLIGKENDMGKAHLQIMELEEMIVELRELETRKEDTIEGLKRRLLAYEETDTLFQEKDEEINRLHKQVAELQLSNRLLSTEVTTQKGRWELKTAELEQQNSELQLKFDKSFASFDLLSRQKEQSDSSNRKVIGNLKDKIKSLAERINELQGQLVQFKIARELREHEYNQLLNNYETLKSQSAFTEPMIRRDQRQIIASSASKEFTKLGDDLNYIDRMEDNAFEEEIMLLGSGEQNLKKVQEIINENSKLKQRISNLESRGQRQMKQQNDRLRKRLAVMKKRNDQLQTQKRDELQLMVSVFDQCLRQPLP